MTINKKHKIGDLVIVGLNRKFPVVLREGPGYTFDRAETIDPSDVAIILKETTGHGAIAWVLVHVADKEKKGWVPESMLRSTR